MKADTNGALPSFRKSFVYIENSHCLLSQNISV